MLSPTQMREHAPKVDEVLEYMRRRKLSRADLIEIGGEDLRSSHCVEKARCVANTWALIARLGVAHVDI
jgi:hypothetical protein